MPVQPLWFARIPALLATLQAETAPPEFRRGHIERLLGVRRRRAILVLHRCGAFRRRANLVVPRESLVAYLAEQWDEKAAARAAEQEQQVAQTLAQARRALTLPSILLPTQLSSITFAGLPPGIRLTRQELSVTFSSAQDLVEKLFTLAQAFANDYESLEEVMARSQPAERRGA